MSARWSTWLAVSLWVVAVIVVVCVLVVEYANGGLIVWLIPQGYVAAILAVLTMATVGALLAIHRPSNAIGWIDLVAGISLGILGLAVGYAEYSTVTNPDGAPEIYLLFWLGAWIWVPGYFVLPSIGILVFPTGRLPSQRWRWFAWLVGALLALMVVAEMFAPGPLLEPDEFPGITNPVSINPLSGLFSQVTNHSQFLIVVILGGPIISIFARLRAASAVERQQLKWFAYAAVVPVAGLVLYFTLVALPMIPNETANRVGEYVVLLGVAVLPVTIGIAILRHNLYDIDRLINRTLVYGSLMLLLGLSFGGSVVVLQVALAPLTNGNDLAVAGSTLLSAAIFRPALQGIQRVVDRRFFRQKYDAGRALAEFSSEVRDNVDVTELTREVERTIGETVRPAHVSIWLRPADHQTQEITWP